MYVEIQLEMYVFYRFFCCCVIKLELKTNWKLYGAMHSCIHGVIHIFLPFHTEKKMNHKLESRLLGNINNFRYADDITLMAESERN